MGSLNEFSKLVAAARKESVPQCSVAAAVLRRVSEDELAPLRMMRWCTVVSGAAAAAAVILILSWPQDNGLLDALYAELGVFL